MEDLEKKIEAWAEEFAPCGVAVFKTPMGTMVFKPASADDLDRWTDRMQSDKGSKSAALKELAQRSVIYPSLDEARRIFERLPLLPITIGNRLIEMGGGTIEGEVKKA